MEKFVLGVERLGFGVFYMSELLIE